MKILDIDYLNGEILAKAESTSKTDDVRDDAQRILHLMDLLTEEYINEEILAVPVEEWAFEEELVALEDGTTPIARYILANEEKRGFHNHYYSQFRTAPLPKARDFV